MTLSEDSKGGFESLETEEPEGESEEPEGEIKGTFEPKSNGTEIEGTNEPEGGTESNFSLED